MAARRHCERAKTALGFVCLAIARLCPAQDQSALAIHSERAHEAQRQGDYKTAAAEWSAITQLAPDVPEAYSNLGLMRHFGGQYSDAIEAFLHASKLNPRLVAPHLFLGIDYYLTARSKEAVPQLKAALVLSPHDVTADKWLGMSYFQLGRYEQSVNELNAASLADPRDSDLLFYLSRAYSKILFQSYDAIRGIDPQSPFVKALRGEDVPIPEAEAEIAPARAALQEKRAGRAFQLMSDLVRRSPQNACNWFWFGKSSEALALNSLDRFLAAAPKSYRADQLKAEYFLALGNDAEAISEYRKALVRKPDATQFHESLGNLYMTHHDYERAIPEYESELRVNPYALVSLERVGQAYLELNDPTKASSYLARAIRIDSRSYEGLRNLGRMFFESGDCADAVKNYRAAIEINGEAEPAVLFQLSQAYRRLGNKVESDRWLAHFRQALDRQHSLAERKLATSSPGQAWPR